MFKAIKDNKIIAINDEEIKGGLQFDEMIEDEEHTVEDYEQYDGEYVLKKEVPVEYLNEQIRQQRQARFIAEADPLKYDYEDSLALGEELSEEKKQIWLQKKQQIRKELPYLEE